MRWLAFGGICLILIILGGTFLYFNKLKPADLKQKNINTPLQTSNDEGSAEFCTEDQLQAQLNPNVGAGNVFVQAVIKNISQTECKIQGDSLPEVGYPNSVQNIKIQTIGQPSQKVFILKPNQVIYSQLHYPNGPQCSSPVLEVNAMVSDQISPETNLTFQPQGSTTLDIPICTAQAEITEIQIWPFSTQPITQ